MLIWMLKTVYGSGAYLTVTGLSFSHGTSLCELSTFNVVPFKLKEIILLPRMVWNIGSVIVFLSIPCKSDSVKVKSLMYVPL